MTSRFRLLAASATFAAALVLSASESPLGAAQQPADLCFQDLYGGGEWGHDFGIEGIMYTCAPNTCHGGTWSGSCGMHHYLYFDQ